MDRIQARKLLKGAFILFSIYFLLKSAIRSLFADFTASEISDSGLWDFLMVFRIFQSCHRIFYIHIYASLPCLKFYLLHKDSHCECVLFILLLVPPSIFIRNVRRKSLKPSNFLHALLPWLEVDCSQKSSVPKNLMAEERHRVVDISYSTPGHLSDHSNFINSKFESDKFNNWKDLVKNMLRSFGFLGTG